jgi:putative thioredoxin
MTSSHVVHVNESDFQVEVLAHSSQRPVIVDFWAEWSEPSRLLDPILERLADEASGGFRLAKLDVDANPGVAEDYGVRGVPAVKAFRNGQVVAEFSGLRPEPQIRDFVKALEPAPNDLLVGRADSLLNAEQWEEAEDLYRDALDENPDHPGALLGLARTLLAQGEALQSLPILREFPVSKEYTSAERLIPLAEALAELEAAEDGDIEDAQPVYTNALRLASRGQILAAMDGLLDVLREDKSQRKGAPRKVLVGLLEVLGNENPQTREYRNELAQLLF